MNNSIEGAFTSDSLSNLRQAKLLVREGKLESARIILTRLLTETRVHPEVYQMLVDICAFTEDIDGFIEFYSNAIESGFGGRIYSNQLYHNCLKRIKTQQDIERLIDFFQDLLENHVVSDKFAYLSLSYLYTKAEDIKRSIDINQKCLYQFVIKKKKLDPPIDLLGDKNNLKAPDFIIIGTLKSGTTSLYDYLTQHPKILPAIVKEVRFFSSFFTNGYEWYFSHFPNSLNQDCLSGEATPGYFSSARVPERLHSTLPNAKLVLCLRNPVDRTLSHYFMDVREGRQSQTLEQILEKLEKKSNLFDNNQQNFLDKIPLCFSDSFYYFHLRKWLKFFPLSQIQIINSQDLFQSPNEIVNDVFEFIGLEKYETLDFKIRNEGQYSRVSDSIRHQISSLFEPQNRLLEKLTGRKFN